jgi:hypothetical protein
MLGERHLHRRAAVLEARVNRGRVVLVGFRAQHRGQPHATFKLLFNSIYLSASEPAASARLQAPASGAVARASLPSRK